MNARPGDCTGGTGGAAGREMCRSAHRETRRQGICPRNPITCLPRAANHPLLLYRANLNTVATLASWLRAPRLARPGYRAGGAGLPGEGGPRRPRRGEGAPRRLPPVTTRPLSAAKKEVLPTPRCSSRFLPRPCQAVRRHRPRALRRGSARRRSLCTRSAWSRCPSTASSRRCSAGGPVPVAARNRGVHYY